MVRGTQCICLLRTLVILAAGSALVWADPIGLSLNPSTTSVTTGSSVNVDVTISGLGLPPEVGSFDIFVLYNPALVTPTGITFGTGLGDPLLFEALTASSLPFTTGIAEGAEVSLLPTSTLDAIQSPGFSLFTMNFTGIGSGTASFQYFGGPVDDGNGNLIFGTKSVIPEPGSLVMLGTGVGVLILSGRLHRRAIGARAG